MTGTPETAEQLDTAIDSLLQEHDGPRALSDGELAATARQLYDALPRLHPHFSFEEHLARRLAVLRAEPIDRDAPEPTRLRPVALVDTDPADDVAAAAARRRRGLVAGGAIASGVSLAIPIAGAALVVWRRSRSSGGLL